MDDTPVLKRDEADADTICAWHCGDPASWSFRTIRVGVLVDGRWFVALTGRRDLTLACRDGARALQLAREWMSDGSRWVQSIVQGPLVRGGQPR
jgi:hypothetical protein